MRFLNLRQGTPFKMGRAENYVIISPKDGPVQLTLNHSIQVPGCEFPQHTHDETEDVFVVLEGSTAVRQGDVYTPIVAGEVAFIPAREVHGTFNNSNLTARLISFQVPPDAKLYSGQRDSSRGGAPVPQPGHTSGVQVVALAKGGPAFGKAGRNGNWRSVVSPVRGSKNAALDFITLDPGHGFDHEPVRGECVYVLLEGQAAVRHDGQDRPLSADDVLYLAPGDTFSLCHAGAVTAKIVRCEALAAR
ncbi:MAG: cupin domain-containing protein [Planctomycetes bacterium]|nr:cupin domain-containing protein [Planctomycetota bacterium]